MLENVAEFLTALTYHNDRDWFMAHKSEYMEAKAEFDSFVERLILAVASFDPTVGLLEAKDCCYRIYRDVRFSWDKSPYKTWMGAYICRGGRKSGYAGYYFHFQPVSGGLLLDGSMLAAGLYRPSSAMLGKIRRGIYSHGRAFHTAVMRADGFSLDPDRRLQRVPPGFENAQFIFGIGDSFHYLCQVNPYCENTRLMKKSVVSLILICCHFISSAQNSLVMVGGEHPYDMFLDSRMYPADSLDEVVCRVNYSYSFVTDTSGNITDRGTGTLEIGRNVTKYYNYYYFLTDSLVRSGRIRPRYVLRVIHPQAWP